jgi:predicted transglutaminase-like cysteine proteinase
MRSVSAPTPVRLLVVAVTLIIVGRIIGVGEACARDLTPPTEHLRLAVGMGAQPTPAWQEFCRRLPAECEVDAAEPEFIALTPAIWTLIASVNTFVNASIGPMTDRDHWGVEDRWDFPDDGHGDCEDFQILKRKLLAEAGLPRRAMRMAVVLDQAGEGHAVLMLRTDQGEYILDNKSSVPALWSDTGYHFVKREGSDGPAWVALSQEASAIVTANQ